MSPTDVLPRPAGIARRILPTALRGYLRRYLRRPPVNLRLRDSSQPAIDADVAYALQVGQAYLGFFAAEDIDPCGKSVLELGPGINFGSALVLACHGVRPILADRFLANWDANYHPKFHSALRRTLAEHDSAADLTLLDRLLGQDAYADDGIRRIARSAEDLRGIPDSSIDIVVSNAVLEHLFDLPAACRELGRVSKPLAWGFHQVDFRDHRDFQRPPEFLLLGDRQFRRIFAERHGECGSQWRPSEAAEFFEETGFEMMRFETTCLLTRIILANSSCGCASPPHATGICRLRNCVHSVDSFAFAVVRRIRPLGIEAR
jgi:SAM-dependent methyltransferase